jgi:hypothetical protein
LRAVPSIGGREHDCQQHRVESVYVNGYTAFDAILENTIDDTLACHDNAPSPASAGNTANHFVGARAERRRGS